MEADWKLSDVFNFNRFEKAFEVDDLVKITINNPDGSNGESFWIRITEASGKTETKTFSNGFHRPGSENTRFKGAVDNDLIEPIYPRLGEIIEFNIGNIIRKWEM